MQVINDDCRNAMRGMDADSISAIVTDPPYGLKFMGKGWDHSVPGLEFWQEALRVAKPGCHLLAFGGTRTYHRLTCAIEDAGWEIRDSLMWVYGSGFPKGHDVSKAIDKEAGAERDKRWKPVTKYSMVGTLEPRPWLDKARENGGCFVDSDIPSTDAAKQWEGWNTSLKPSFEPIILARKPLTGTVAGNVLEHGTGAINIDACRVKSEDSEWTCRKSATSSFSQEARPWKEKLTGIEIASGGVGGRWPANFIHDGSDEVLELFPRSKGGGNVPSETDSKPSLNCYGEYNRVPFQGYKDDGSAARFFYCAKASPSERGEYNTHATVKPLALMRYLIKLITPPNGILLDPFAGSGSTLVAASQLGFDAIGIELDKVHCDIIERRLKDSQGVFAE